MESRAPHNEINMFEWGDESRLMTVIRGIPMYRSSGKNSGYKNTWFPHLGIDGTRWVRKPRKCLPSDIIAYCQKIALDQKIALRRFGNTQSICISASIGTGFWKTDDGVKLKKFLIENHDHYFLSDDELEAFHKTLKSRSNSQVRDIVTANSYLMQYGSWISTDYQSRLPSDEEYKFFSVTDNLRVRTALRMMLTSKHCITTTSYNMICKLSEHDTLFDYALSSGLLETHQNIQSLTNMMMTQKKSLKLQDLVKLNSLNNILLPFPYKHFKTIYACRKILRKLHPTALTARTFEIMDKLDRLYLLDRYSDLFLNDEARLGLIYLDNIKQLNCKMLKKLWKTYIDYERSAHLENPGPGNTEMNHSSINSRLEINSLFAVKNKAVDLRRNDQSTRKQQIQQPR
jgi:hypothetical protein